MKSKSIGRLALVSMILVLTLAMGVSASKPQFNSEFRYNIHYLTQAKEVAAKALTGVIAAEGEFSDAVSYYISVSGEKIWKPVEESKIEIDKAYMDFFLSHLDVRTGYQVVNWGTADGINPTSDVNPQNLSIADMMPGSVPVPAVKMDYYLPSGASITAVTVLKFVPGELAQAKALTSLAQVPKGTEQMEWAVRCELPIGGRRIYATYFNGWQDLPAAWLQLSLDAPPMPQAKYRRQQSVGLATATTIGDAAFWLEGAYKKPQQLAELETGTTVNLSTNDPYLQVVAGIDYTFANGLFTSGQIYYNQAGSMLNPYEPKVGNEGHTYLIGQSMFPFGEGHSIDLTTILDVKDKGWLLAPKYSYRYTDHLQFQWGALVLGGDNSSEFASLKSLTQGINVGVKVLF